MLIKRINRASPEQVFVVVKNNDTAVASTGHAVLFDYRTGGTTGDGYSVRLSYSATDTYANPGLFAGIVAGRDIPPADYGSIQVWGHTSRVVISGGVSSAPFYSVGQTAWDDATLTNIHLRPACLFGNTTGAATNRGYLGIMSAATSIGTQSALDCRPFAKGGYVVPVDQMYFGTTAGTITYTSTGTCKAFIRCLM